MFGGAVTWSLGLGSSSSFPWGKWEWVGQNRGARGRGRRCQILLTAALVLATSPLSGMAAPQPPWINLASYHWPKRLSLQFRVRAPGATVPVGAGSAFPPLPPKLPLTLAVSDSRIKHKNTFHAASRPHWLLIPSGENTEFFPAGPCLVSGIPRTLPTPPAPSSGPASLPLGLCTFCSCLSPGL